MKFYTGIWGNKLNMWWHFCCGLDHNPALGEIYAHFTLSNSGGMSWSSCRYRSRSFGACPFITGRIKTRARSSLGRGLCSQSVPSNSIFKSYFLTKPGTFGFAKYYHEVIKVHLFSHQRVFYTITANKIVRFSDIYFSPGFILTILFLCSKIIIPILAAISINQVCSNLKICTKECRALVVKG